MLMAQIKMVDLGWVVATELLDQPHSMKKIVERGEGTEVCCDTQLSTKDHGIGTIIPTTT